MTDPQRLTFRNGALLADALLEAASTDELHGDVKVALIMPHGVELDHVGVVHVRGDERLASELLHALGIAAIFAIEDF